MASHVQVILKEDVEHLGHTGEVVRVRPGYARNYLMPRDLAAMATRASIRQVEHETKLAMAKADKQRKQAAGLASALAEITFEISRQASDEGKLYGSVSTADVAKLLQEKGYAVDRRKVLVPGGAIKTVGVHELEVKLGGGVRASFKIDVKAEA
ncbi:MAG: 50S ribosomal protein L9 [Myxococcales bacterium]|nr:50S ribosomal protein L9 [Myxococcales bacterium]